MSTVGRCESLAVNFRVLYEVSQIITLLQQPLNSNYWLKYSDIQQFKLMLNPM